MRKENFKNLLSKRKKEVKRRKRRYQR